MRASLEGTAPRRAPPSTPGGGATTGGLPQSQRSNPLMAMTPAQPPIPTIIMSGGSRGGSAAGVPPSQSLEASAGREHAADYSIASGRTPYGGAPSGYTNSVAKEYSLERDRSQATVDQSSIDNADNFSAASTVQTMLLKSRLSSMHSEMTKLRVELKEANENKVNLSLQLNQHKIDLTTTQKKFTKAQQRKDVLEAEVKRLEELLATERASHVSTREMSERVREQLAQKEAIISSQTELVKRDKEAKTTVNVNGTIQALEMENRALKEERMHELDNYQQYVNDITVRLMDLVEANESRLFVCRSEILSYCTDLETRLARVDQENTRLQSALNHFTQEVEGDTRLLVGKLMEENRGLWVQLQTDYGKIDRLKEEQQAYTSKQQEKDTHYTTELQQMIEQRNSLERELVVLRDGYEESASRCREGEVALEKAREEYRMVRHENDMLREENQQRNFTLADVQRTLDDGRFQQDEIRKSLEYANSVNLTLTKELQKFRDQNRLLEDKIRWEGLDSGVQQDARKERDAALSQLDTVKRQHDEVMTKYHAAERELQARVDYIAQLKNNMQDTHTSIQRNLHSDFERQRQLWTNEVLELRKENEKKTSEIIDLSKAADREKVNGSTIYAKLLAAEESVQQLQAENESLQGQLAREHAERSRALSEDERLQHSLVSLEGRLRQMESERAKESHEKQQVKHLLEEEKRMHREEKSMLQSQVTDAENQRRQLAAELKQLKDRVHEDSTTYRVKERLEKDKELLLRENERLQMEYRDSRNENADLMRLVGELRDKANSSSRIQAYMQNFERKFQEVNHTRDFMTEFRKLYQQISSDLIDPAPTAALTKRVTETTTNPSLLTSGSTDRSQRPYLGPSPIKPPMAPQPSQRSQNAHAGPQGSSYPSHLVGSYTPMRAERDRTHSPLSAILTDDAYSS